MHIHRTERKNETHPRALPRITSAWEDNTSAIISSLKKSFGHLHLRPSVSSSCLAWGQRSCERFLPRCFTLCCKSIANVIAPLRYQRFNASSRFRNAFDTGLRRNPRASLLRHLGNVRDTDNCIFAKLRDTVRRTNFQSARG